MCVWLLVALLWQVHWLVVQATQDIFEPRQKQSFNNQLWGFSFVRTNGDWMETQPLLIDAHCKSRGLTNVHLSELSELFSSQLMFAHNLWISSWWRKKTHRKYASLIHVFIDCLRIKSNKKDVCRNSFLCPDTKEMQWRWWRRSTARHACLGSQADRKWEPLTAAAAAWWRRDVRLCLLHTLLMTQVTRDGSTAGLEKKKRRGAGGNQ